MLPIDFDATAAPDLSHNGDLSNELSMADEFKWSLDLYRLYRHFIFSLP